MWNAERYTVDHAERYIRFLLDQTQKLSTDYLAGNSVPTRPTLQYAVIRRRRKGHGHLVVYEVKQDTIRVLDSFHTAQDWQDRINED